MTKPERAVTADPASLAVSAVGKETDDINDAAHLGCDRLGLEQWC